MLSKLLKPIRVILLCLLGLLLSRTGPNVLAAERPPQIAKVPTDSVVKEKHILANAIQLQLTPRGLGLFENNLDALLYNLGISFDEVYFSAFQWQSKIKYSVEKIAVPSDQAKTVDAIKKLLIDGLHIHDIQPQIQVGESSYQAVFNRFAIVGDQALLKKLGKVDGAILVLEVEIKEMKIRSDSLQIADRRQPFIGEIKLAKPELKIADGTTPLKIRLPFYTRINPQGIPEFTAMAIEHNLDEFDLQLQYQNLQTPQVQKVQVTMNGISKTVDSDYLSKQINAKLEAEIVELIPKALIEVRKYFSDFASQNLTDLLNKVAKEQLVKSVGELKTLDAPGVDANTPEHLARPYQWGIQLKSLQQNDGLSITLDTFIEDLQNPSLPLTTVQLQQLQKKAPAQMNSLAKEHYDIALALDLEMINRLLQLSFARKLFEQVKISGDATTTAGGNAEGRGKYLRILSLPTVKAINWNQVASPQLGETFLTVSLHVQVPPGTVGGLKKELLIQDEFSMRFDLIVKILKDEKNALRIQLWDVDVNSIQLDPNALFFVGKLQIVKDQIIKTIKAQFKTIAAQWQREKTSLPTAIPIPEILGIPLKLKHLSTEPQGHLVLYLEYQ